jgi:UDP-2,3-diacylglucosamine hydrolase
MSNSSNPTALFVGDTHFHLRPDRAERARLDRFLYFLEQSRQADHLILLGDIFDFWFDYPHFRLKGYEALLNQLDMVRNAGVQLTFVGGNHDIWAANYLHERYGIAGDGGPTNLKLGATRVKLLHGDGILSRDWLYRSFRWIVRQRTAILLAKILHPELLFGVATWLSGVSRKATREEASIIIDRARRWLVKCPDNTWDLLVIGHVHHPFMLEHESRIMASLGGWLGREGYGLLQNGCFELRDFASDPPANLPSRADP